MNSYDLYELTDTILAFSVAFSVISFVSLAAATVISAVLASRKGRSVGGWVVGGLFLGWIGVLIIALLPSLNQRSNGSYITKRTYVGKWTPTRSAPRIVADGRTLCPNCGDAVKGDICGMCGTKCISNKRPAYTPAKRIEIKKAEMEQTKLEKEGTHRCLECGERIDTAQCPWCGYRKK